LGNFANVAWLRHLSRPYYGQWIALREGVLLGANESRSILRQQLKDSGTYQGAVFIKVGANSHDESGYDIINVSKNHFYY